MSDKKRYSQRVFGWPAIHVRDPETEQNPSLKNIFIDVGCSSKKGGRSDGSSCRLRSNFRDELMELNKKYFTGRALDNRMGGFMIAEVVKRLSENKKN